MKAAPFGAVFYGGDFSITCRQTNWRTIDFGVYWHANQPREAGFSLCGLSFCFGLRDLNPLQGRRALLLIQSWILLVFAFSAGCCFGF